MIEIIKINSEDYPQNKKVLFTYKSDKYYGVLITEDPIWNVSLELKEFETTFAKSMEVDIFDDYKQDLQCYIAKINDQEVGIISFNLQDWNNTFRIWDLYIDEKFQGQGIGKTLVEIAINQAEEEGIRAIVLETQTSNYNAIKFYLKSGFRFIGLDTIHYSNQDIENKEVRIEMAYFIE